MMNRHEFELLRDLPGKEITSDIVFISDKYASPNLIFEPVIVQNPLEWEVLLNGTYKPEIPSVTFNFVVKGVGPICRLCVNSRIHKNSGRTHKHDLQDDNDPRKNLPYSIPRPDLNLKEYSVRKIWEILCQQANIRHSGHFIDPAGDRL
ncbi:MAG: hypothetical protein AB1656_22335 [Candidatus Omnitrophota bacterium]